jgi:hypothetical protein
MKKYLKIANIALSFCIAIILFSCFIDEGIAPALFPAYYGWAAWWGVQYFIGSSLQKLRSGDDSVTLFDFPIGIILGFTIGCLGPGIIKFVRYLRSG